MEEVEEEDEKLEKWDVEKEGVMGEVEDMRRLTAPSIFHDITLNNGWCDSYFRFDDDNKIKYTYFLQSSENKRLSLKHKDSYIAQKIMR